MFGIDDAIVGGAIGAIGSIGGSLIGAHSARAANEANIAASREQMNFQERMRATQYQTAVQDLQKAGLNPMLAYTNGGAGTPSGAMAVSRPEFDSASGAQAVQSALGFLGLKNQTDQVKATVKNIDADTLNKLAESQRIMADTQLKTAMATSESYRPQLLVKQAQLAGSQSHQIDTLLYDTMAKIRAETAQSYQSAKQLESQRVLMKELQSNEWTKGWAPFLYDVFRPAR